MADYVTCKALMPSPTGESKPCGRAAVGVLQASPLCFYHLMEHFRQAQTPADVFLIDHAKAHPEGKIDMIIDSEGHVGFAPAET